MRVRHGRQENSASEPFTKTFTGIVYGDPIVSGEGEAAIRVASVLFHPGARTYWHSHGRGQVLLVTSGEGRVQSAGGDGRRIRAGDVVQVDPGEVHWHGAGPDTYVVHTAVSLGITNWSSEVTDAEYSAVLTTEKTSGSQD
jgi:quercetin dioxygenase-like cupin family protein